MPGTFTANGVSCTGIFAFHLVRGFSSRGWGWGLPSPSHVPTVFPVFLFSLKIEQQHLWGERCERSLTVHRLTGR